MCRLHCISSFFSGILSPLLMPVYGMSIALWLSPLVLVPLSTRINILLVIFLLTTVLPIIIILGLKAMGVIEDPHLNNRKERLIPYIAMIVCYVAGAIYLWTLHAPMWLCMFLFGGGCAALISMLVNFVWKISAHMAGIGGLLALICRIHAEGSGFYDLEPLILVVILLMGVLGTSRLTMERHTFWQIVAGSAVGFLCVYYL